MPLAPSPRLALNPRDPKEHHRASTTLELFFDLISVIAIAAVTAGLHHAISEGHGLEALPRFVFLFLAIWWAWMNFTWFASAFDNDDTAYRVLVMVIMGGELIFAGGAGHIFATMDFSYGLLGWIIMRLGMVALWLRAAAGHPDHRRTALRYAAGITLAQICWTAMYFSTVPGSPSFFLAAGLCFMVEWATPMVAERAGGTPFHRHHMIERYGLLTIISLGEIMLAISHGFGALFGDHPSVHAALVAVSALVIVFAVWWIYFCEQEPLPTTDLPVALVWGYGHVFIFMGIAALGAAVAALVDVVTDHAHATEAGVAQWLGGALVLICLALWVTRDRVLALAPRFKLALPVLALAYGLAALTGAPIWVFALMSVAGVIWRAPRPPAGVHGLAGGPRQPRTDGT
ncbi:MAG: low temperature requirement protein A [Paracoccaceae bacterium]